MIFTDKFVYVHEPKTGGTFVTTMLFTLYNLKWTRLTHLRNILFKEVRAKNKYGYLIHSDNKHGGCQEIPLLQQGKKILATIRNPYDMYVSQYEFGWWKRKEFMKYYQAVPEFKKNHPHFPDITFAEYVYLSNAAFGKYFNNQPTTADIGLRTREFVNFYCKNPSGVFARITNDHSCTLQKYASDLHDIYFIRTDQLNQGLYHFLLQMGYAHEDISFILNHGKVLPQGKGRSAEQKWEKYYTPELKAFVREKERVLFTLFPEFENKVNVQ
jgi:hypothetical protein